MISVTLKSPDTTSIVKIEKGELVSYQKNNEELIHQKGTLGWRNSDTEMFPIIGPTESKNFRISTPKGTAIQDQHGLLRELSYSLLKSSEYDAVFQKKYIANTFINNSKYPEKSTEKGLCWPYNFTFFKKYEITNSSLKISFELQAENKMPFMLGYHPAFMLQGNLDEIVQSNNQNISIPNIIEGGSTALPILNTTEVQLIKKNGFNISIKTMGFNNFMLWTEVPTMLCIEPITAYPYTDGELLSKKLFNKSKGIDIFEVLITPFKII